MKQQILKYNLSVFGDCDISMPIGAEILSVQVQNGVLCMWAICLPRNKTEIRSFLVYNTGEFLEAKIEKKFLATILIHGGAIVRHVFERIK